MYINVRVNPVSTCRLVKTVYTNVIAEKRKLHKVATTNNSF